MAKKAKTKVLVVDDEKAVLFTYKLLLERQGYATTAVLSAHEAKQELERTAFDILLCDLSLEENHSGFEVIDYARQKYSRIGCILLTGYATSEAVQKAESIGVMVLYKPIEIKEFVSAIPAVLRELDAQTKAGRGKGRIQAA